MSSRKFLGAVLILHGLSFSAFASENSAEPTRLLAKYDANGDQVISLSEVEEKRKQIFSAMDFDRSGTVDFSEYEQLDKAKRSMLLKARFDKLDANQDGQLSGGEYASYLGSFDRMDRNSDGQLSHAEIQKTGKNPSQKTSVKREADHCVLWFCLRKDPF